MDIKKYSFSIGVEEISIDDFIKRYHFDEENREIIQASEIFLAGLLTVEAAVCYGQEQVVCAVTLGENYDELEGLVEKSGNLFLCYCIECLGMEFLSRAYEKINEHFYEDRGKWLGAYQFLDLETELPGKENVPESEKGTIGLAAVLDALGISWQKGMLSPLKSVVFTAKCADEKEKNSCHDCEMCGNLSCVFREKIHKKEKKKNTVTVPKRAVYSYGISRILENRKKMED